MKELVSTLLIHEHKLFNHRIRILDFQVHVFVT